MNIGTPQKTHIVTPQTEPVPQWVPEREPFAVPQTEPVFAEPVFIPTHPEKVNT